MSKEKQIEEMAELICDNKNDCGICSTDGCVCNYNCEYKYSAEALYEAGYRRQSEGEWISNSQTDEYICSLCDGIAPVDCLKEDFYKSNFCPNCGAKMKGGA